MIYKSQKDLIDYLVAKLKELSGVEALYLKGSIARNESDQYSDVDFYCLVSEEIYEEMIEKREELLEEYRTILYKSKVNFGIEQVVVIFDNNIHLDFYVTKEIPDNGFDEIMVLYDQRNVLSKYRRKKNVIESKEIAKYLNSAIYTLLEIDVAYRREDELWLMRLTSHMLADISLVLSHIYNSDNPVLHMKGLYSKLPENIKSRIDIIMKLMTPDNSKSCIIRIIELFEIIVDMQNKEVKGMLHTKYLEYMKEKVKTYN